MTMLQARPRQPLIRYPAGVERSLARSYRDFARNLAHVTSEEVAPILPALTQQAYRYRRDAADDFEDEPDDGSDDRQSYLALLIAALKRVISRSNARVRPLLSVAMRHAEQTNAQSVREFEAALRRELGVSIVPREPWLDHELRAFEAENLRLIKSIPQQHVDRLRGKIVEALRRGQTVKQLAQIIQDETGATEARATFIGSDQIGKLFGQLNMLRQRSVGVTDYTWRGVLDRRERPHHVAREGQQFSWDVPPWDGHPGQPPRCRCHASPIWPDIQDLKATIIRR